MHPGGSTGEPARGDVSTLLRAWSDGDQRALAELTPIVYDQLRRLARHYMRRERAGHSLQTTALVNEAYLRLVDYKRMHWQNRAHFLAVAAQAMRRILVDHARRRNLKRGADRRSIRSGPETAHASSIRRRRRSTPPCSMSDTLAIRRPHSNTFVRRFEGKAAGQRTIVFNDPDISIATRGPA